MRKIRNGEQEPVPYHKPASEVVRMSLTALYKKRWGDTADKWDYQRLEKEKNQYQAELKKGARGPCRGAEEKKGRSRGAERAQSIDRSLNIQSHPGKSHLRDNISAAKRELASYRDTMVKVLIQAKEQGVTDIKSHTNKNLQKYR